MTGSAAIRAGLAYGLLAFALGFILGIVRTFLVAPALGAFAAVAIEIPVMLASCVPLAVWCLRRWRIARWGNAALMGLAGFAVLMICEVLLGLALGQGLQAILAAMGKPAGLLGLAGQIAFALLPLGWTAAQRLPRQ
ncbi:hypothetical protein [Novosphingobium sp.]|uniref:hypothetical protein n=1 Tax=Novosphingobium sp. TaxID=1874826 RepID=UPI002635D189|nr:hypothetical protein [Novosphingobium sp.]